MKIAAVIPVRMNSSRLPGKPLADILGLPMVEHVRIRTKKSNVITEVIVATCDTEISEVVKEYGGKVIMTSKLHNNCVDRVAEAALNINADIIVNVQGDEPLVDPDVYEHLVSPLIHNNNIKCTNLLSIIDNKKDYKDKNVVKAVCNLNEDIIYLSREPIPSQVSIRSNDHQVLKQLGVIAFKKAFLLNFINLKQTPLELIESVDMLRVIEHGYKVRGVVTRNDLIGVDTASDLERVRNLMSKDKYYYKYYNQKALD